MTIQATRKQMLREFEEAIEEMQESRQPKGCWFSLVAKKMQRLRRERDWLKRSWGNLTLSTSAR